MKKTGLLFVLVLLLSFGLIACDENPTPPVGEPDVVSVELTNTVTDLIVGTHELKARALPEGSSQLLRLSLVGSVVGVSLDGQTLSISPSAVDQTEFVVRVTSLYDLTISATKTFKVINKVEVIEISTEAELRAINTADNGLNLSYVLVNDIALTTPFESIGTADAEQDDGSIVAGSYFNGLFDGQGYKITNFLIEDGSFNEGFFAQIGTSGVVKNVSIQGVINARGWSGGIAAINEGLITNVVSNIDVNLLGGSAGALVSVNRGTISNSYALGKTTSGTANNLGRSAGLVVANEGVLTNVFGDKETMTTPNYIAFTPTLNDTYMLTSALMQTATTYAEFDTSVWFVKDGFYPLHRHEGFVEPVEKIKTISVNNEALSVDVTLTTEVQLDSVVNNGDESDVLAYALKTEALGISIDQNGLITLTNEAVHLSTFTVVVSLVGNELVFKEVTFNVINNPVPVEDVVEIKTSADIFALATQTDPVALSKTYKVMNDIVLEGWFLNTIGDETTPFTGVFDGQGFTISGLKGGDAQHNFGFFGHIGADGVVKNFNLLGADRVTDLYVGASSGVLASANYGLIENITVNVTITSTGNWVGGLVGNNFGTVRFVIIRSVVSRAEDPTNRGPAFAIANEGTVEHVYVDQTLTGAVSFLHVADAALDLLLVSDSVLKTASTFDAFDNEIWTIVEGSIPVVGK